MKDKQEIKDKLDELTAQHKKLNNKATVPDNIKFPLLNDIEFEDDSLSRGIRILKWILENNNYNNERN